VSKEAAKSGHVEPIVLLALLIHIEITVCFGLPFFWRFSVFRPRSEIQQSRLPATPLSACRLSRTALDSVLSRARFIEAIEPAR